MSSYALVAVWLALVGIPIAWRVVRHVLLVSRLRRMCAVRREPRPFKLWSKA